MADLYPWAREPLDLDEIGKVAEALQEPPEYSGQQAIGEVLAILIRDRRRLDAALDAFLDLMVDSNLEDDSDGESELYRLTEPIGGDALRRLAKALGIVERYDPAGSLQMGTGINETLEQAIFRAAREHPTAGAVSGAPEGSRPATGEPRGAAGQADGIEPPTCSICREQYIPGITGCGCPNG